MSSVAWPTFWAWISNLAVLPGLIFLTRCCWGSGASEITPIPRKAASPLSQTRPSGWRAPGVVAAPRGEVGPSPSAFIANTVTWYSVPLVRPETRIGATGTSSVVDAPGRAGTAVPDPGVARRPGRRRVHDPGDRGRHHQCER